MTLVPHTHWDREWYEPLRVFQARLVGLFDGLLDYLDREPRFVHFHLDGQTAPFEDYLAVRPERRADLERLLRAGRISVGPWFTQADEFLASGETVVRNLEWGLGYAKGLGLERPVDGPWFGYLPDQFGHIAQMPQLLRQAGIARAVVWRGVPGAVTSASFWWQAPDGSQVLAEYFVDGYELGGRIEASLGSPAELAAELDRIAERCTPHIARDEAVVPVGADHTLTPIGLAEQLAEAAALTGRETRIASIASFLAEAPEPDGIPTVAGELRAAVVCPLLPNVYATRPAQKHARARVEHLVERYAEPLCALALPRHAWPGEELRGVWQALLWNAAHDSAYGCVHDETARDVDTRYAHAEATARRLVERAAGALAERSAVAGTLRWNPSPFDRDGLPALGWAVRPDRPSDGETALQPSIKDEGWLDLGPMVSGGRALRLRLRDEDDVGDLYDFAPSADPGRRPPSKMAVDGEHVRLEWPGLAAEIRATHRSGEPFVRLSVQLDNGRPDHRVWLEVELATPVAGSTALTPFALVDRPLASEGGPIEDASTTWPASGAVLAGDAAVYAQGVLEYEAGERLAIVLLRASGIISRDWLPTRRVDAGPGTPTPEAQLIGRWGFELAVEVGAERERMVEHRERFALPILEVEAGGGGPGPAVGRLLEVEGAALSAIRRVGDGQLEVRIWNPADEPRVASVAGRSVPLGAARIESIRID